MKTLTRLLRLSRIGLAPLTMSVPVLGALTAVQPLPTGQLLALAAVGLSAHLFGFGLNDLIDLPFDRRVPARQASPLVRGEVRPLTAWAFVLLQVPTALLLYRFTLTASQPGLILLIVSMILSVGYNLWSKRGRLPRFLAEAALAGAIGCLGLAGSLTQTDTLARPSLIFALSLSLTLLLLNSIPSGLKDLKTDMAAGAHSFVIALGSRMAGPDRLHIPVRVWAYSFILQAIIIGLMIRLMSLFDLSLFVMGLIGLLLLLGSLHLRLILSLRSFNQLRQAGPLLNGYYNYAALALLVLGQMPFWLQAAYGLAIAALLLIPLQRGLRLWRRRYELLP